MIPGHAAIFNALEDVIADTFLSTLFDKEELKDNSHMSATLPVKFDGLTLLNLRYATGSILKCQSCAQGLLCKTEYLEHERQHPPLT